jgi:two-component system chemotaxis sensor kinase CheA
MKKKNQVTVKRLQNPEPGIAADSDQSLDDLAAFMVQLEADDRSGLAQLQEKLTRFANNRTYSSACRKHLKAAAKKIDSILTAKVKKPEKALVKAGKCIEEAMNAQEEIRQVSATGSSSANASSARRKNQRKAPVKGTPDSNSAGNDPAPKAPAVQKKRAAEDPEAKRDYMPRDLEPELLAEFITEAKDLISSAEEALLSLEVDPEDVDAVGKVFRAFHTVKGTSAFLDLTLITELGHHAESLLSRVRDREIRYSGGYADLALRALDMIKELIVSVQVALKGSPLTKPASYDELMELLADPEEAGISDEIDEVPEPRIGDILIAQGTADRAEIEKIVASHPREQVGLALLKSKSASITEIGQALRTQQRMKASTKVVESSIRVSTQRLDRLIDMVGEMVIAHSMVAQDHLVLNNNNHQLQKKVNHTSKIVRELQDISMSMRMVPLKATFNKMARLVRDVSRKVGKNVRFVTDGEDTEIDRNLVDVINDPLVHMVRNAVDHGIEPSKAREQIGKPKYGVVELSAYHSAGSVVVEIRDDGQGLDRDVILAKAKELGMFDGDTIDTAKNLSDKEVYNIIFEPGFSTNKTVTNVSGRGVGMDVVRRNLESLRGQVEIKSEPGKGSVFKMSVPLTLAIIDGMVVGVGSETYVIPTVSIVSSLKPAPGDVSTVLNQGQMLSLQGSLIPLLQLAQLYNVEGQTNDKDKSLVVVVEDDECRTGLIVDALVGRQQVVIKSLGETMRNIPGISGGAIMSNGRVGLILDVGSLVKFANSDPGGGTPEDADTRKRSLAA